MLQEENLPAERESDVNGKGWFFMSSRFYVSLLSIVMLSSCTGLPTGRSYLSEMEHDDSTFFNPERDFPIVAGDTGESWLSDDERKLRTPASEDDLFRDRTNMSLREELRSLESSQSEESLELYSQYKDKMRSTSERIYFLKLPPRERRDYLITRGFLTEPVRERFTPHERLFAVRKNDILMGMTKVDVMESWGKPLRVEVAGNPRNENERWLYRMNGAQKFIYFESGKVEGWE